MSPTPTTRYTKRDLRAADMLAFILLGVGLILVVVGGFQLATGPSSHGKVASEVAGSAPAEPVEGGAKPGGPGVPARGAKGSSGAGPIAALTVGGALLLAGLALGLKVRSLIRSGGHEPEEYPGVPEG